MPNKISYATINTKLRLVMFVLLCLLVAIFAKLAFSDPKTPTGVYDTAIIGHGGHNERFVFKAGQVALVGDEGPDDPWGRYTEEAALGLENPYSWVWRTGYEKNWVLLPRWTGLICIELTNAQNRFFIKRRILGW